MIRKNILNNTILEFFSVNLSSEEQEIQVIWNVHF